MSKKSKGFIYMIICVFFWGFSFISIKITVAVFPPMSLGMLRFAIAVVILYFIKLKFAPSEKLNKKDIPLLFGAGLLGVTLYFFFENNGVALVSASEASISIGSIPALAIIAEWAAGKIKKKKESAIGIFQWIGCIISIAGVILVAGISVTLSGSIMGYVYMSAAAVSWVIYNFLTRPLFSRCSRIYIVFWQTAAGFICFIPFSIPEFNSWGISTPQIIFHLVFLGICCSALGYLFYVEAMENLGIPVCSVFINLIPVVTVIAGFFVLHDRLTIFQWLGAALVITGVYMSQRKSIKAVSG